MSLHSKNDSYKSENAFKCQSAKMTPNNLIKNLFQWDFDSKILKMSFDSNFFPKNERILPNKKNASQRQS